MAINLVSLISDLLTPTMVGRIASALGVEPSILQTAVNAAVPGLLSGFTGVSDQPGGAQKLADAARQQSGALDNVASTINAASQSMATEGTSGLLTSLLGGRGQNALTDAVSRFTGLGSGATGSLLGMLAPLAMGTIAKQTRPLSADGITNLLASQKDNIAAALPRGFSDLLGGTGLLDSLGGAARTATAAGSQAGRYASSAASAMSSTGQRASDRASTSRWAYWLIPAAAIAGLLLYLFNKPAEQAIQQGTPIAQSLTVNGQDVGNQVTASIGTLRDTLGSVTDTKTAEAALPKLHDVNNQIEQVNGLVGQMTPDQKKTLAGIVNPVMPALKQLADNAVAVPGVAKILKPTIDGIRAKLETMIA